ncbi:hypothetical protein Droror1_Dr00026510, partial [Drosera rotundifolia]
LAARADLYKYQFQLCDSFHVETYALMLESRELLHFLEQSKVVYFKQLARANLYSEVHRNSKNFHAYIKAERRARFPSLISIDESNFMDPPSICSEFISYYQKLLGTSNCGRAIEGSILKAGPFV